MVAIIAIVAAVVIPNVSGFLRTGRLSAANGEVATVKTASAAYYAGGGNFTATSAAFYPQYLDKMPKSTYTFEEVGRVTEAPNDGWTLDPGFTFDVDEQQWKKQTP